MAIWGYRIEDGDGNAQFVGRAPDSWPDVGGVVAGPPWLTWCWWRCGRPPWLTWCWWRCGRPPIADLMLVALWQASTWNSSFHTGNSESFTTYNIRNNNNTLHCTLYVLYNVQQEIKYLLWRDSRASLIQILTLNDNVEGRAMAQWLMQSFHD